VSTPLGKARLEKARPLVCQGVVVLKAHSQRSSQGWNLALLLIADAVRIDIAAFFTTLRVTLDAYRGCICGVRTIVTGLALLVLARSVPTLKLCGTPIGAIRSERPVH